MTNEIKSGKLNIINVFEQWYRIPEYQRPYVWEEEQVLELLEDISSSARINKDAEYFLGSIVYQIKDVYQGNIKYKENDVLDGQQRLTTLLLVMAVIRDLEKDRDKGRSQNCQKSIYQKEDKDDNVPERLRIVYDIREEVKQFINKVLKEEGGTLNNSLLSTYEKSKDISIKNMINAIGVIRDYFNVNSIDEFFPYLKTKVLLIYVASENLEDAFRMFTILNDRGIKLRNSDILKAENLRVVVNESDKKTYARLWEDMESEFGENFDEFLSHIRTILAKDKALKNLLYEFEEKIYKKKIDDKPILKKGADTFELIKRYHDHYLYIFEESKFELIGNSYELDNLITIMKSVVPSNIWIPVLLKYYDKFGTNDLFRFTKRLDNKFSYDWINQETPTKRIENMNSIIKLIDSSSSPSDVIDSEEIIIDAKNVKNLIRIISGPIYQKSYCKYLLFKLDYIYGGYQYKTNIPKDVSVEHILPQNPKSDSLWVQDFNEEQREGLTDVLGNLVLIGRRKNTSLGRLDYKEKKEKYFKKNIENFPNVLRIMNENSWKVDDLERNQKEVLRKLEEHYSNT